jgi:hypothetical protein
MMMIHRAIASLALLCAALAQGNEATSREQSFVVGPSRLRRTTAVTVGTITGLRLVDTDTDKPIPGYDPLPLVARIDLNTLPSPNLSLEALTNGTVKSVSWRTQSFSRIDNFAPWSMCYNSGADFNPCKVLVAGFDATITAVPFAVSSAQAGRGTPYKIQLSLYRGASTKAPVQAVFPTKAPIAAVAPTKAPIISVAPTKAPAVSPTIKSPAASPTSFNAPTKKPVVAPTPKPPTKAPVVVSPNAPAKAPTKKPLAAPTTKAPTTVRALNLTFVDLLGEKTVPLVNNSTVDYKIAPYTVRAESVGPSMQSVQFIYDGRVVRVENTAPIVLAGKQGSILSPWVPTQGRHTLTATAYSKKNASGVVLASSTISFVARPGRDSGVPLLLKFRPTETVNTLSPPKSLEISVVARDDESGIARATVYLYTYVSFQNYIDRANVTKRFDAVSSTRAKPFAFNMSLPYPSDLPPGVYDYRIEVEDFAGNIGDGENADHFKESTDVYKSFFVQERRVELLNVTVTPMNPITINASGLPIQVQTQITIKDSKGWGVCVSASGNGFSTEDPIETEFGSSTAPTCKSYPDKRVPEQPVVLNLTLDMRPYFQSGAYELRVYTSDFSFDSAYLASKGFPSVVNLVNPYVRSDWKAPQIKSLTALSPTILDLSMTGEVNVTTRLVIQDDVSGFDGEIQFWLNNRFAAKVSAKNKPLVAGQPTTFDVGLPIFDRPGTYPLSLVFKDRFRNTANITSAILAQLGFPLLVEVKGFINPPLANIEFLDFDSAALAASDVSYGYRRIILAAGFGREMGFPKFGNINLTATGVSDSNRGVMLQGSDRGCHPRYGSQYPFYYCFILDDTTPLGLYLMTADLRLGLVYDAAALVAKGFANNFTVTTYLTTGLGP